MDDLSSRTIASDAEELAINLPAVEEGATIYYLRALRRGAPPQDWSACGRQDACLECVGTTRARRTCGPSRWRRRRRRSSVTSEANPAW